MAIEGERSRRISNFELLRILSMFLIVCNHIGVHSEWPFRAWGEPLTLLQDQAAKDEFTIGVISTGGKTGVNLFLLLSGYFLNGRHAKMRNLIQSWIPALEWSYIMFAVDWYIRDGYPYYRHTFRRVLFPVLSCMYWFLTPFFIALIMSPVIAKIANTKSVREHVAMLFVQFVTFCVVWTYNLGEGEGYAHTLLFMFIISLGSALRRYQEKLKRISTLFLLVSLCILFLFNAWTVHYIVYNTDENFRKFASKHGGIGMLSMNLYSPVPLAEAVIIFLLTMKTPQFSSRIIDEFASVTFGVYLVHDNMMIRYRIWIDSVGAEHWLGKPYFGLRMILACICVFVASCFLEKLRQISLYRFDHAVVNAVLALCELIDARIITPILGSSSEANSGVGLEGPYEV